MNYIQRDKTVLPELDRTCRQFQKEIFGMTKKEAYQHFKARSHILKYNTSETTSEFKRINYERCSFCTMIIQEFDREMTVEHIETKSDVPEKIYEWNNLLCACKAYNTKRSIKKYDDKKYLDPTKVEDIEKYFSYRGDGSIIVNGTLSDGEKAAAEYMIGLYGLDRDSLNYERRRFFNDLLDDEFFEGLLKQRVDSRRIVFRSVFAYYKRRTRNGK